ncbi:hypothetical protein C1645_742829 [Glomus cerebriforme]|uniref:CCHC-type domain-containing protein n=1 Tax=Glomus cerebriforme TaxID=658196 RepID=A0A397SGD5_9GLOM|nr:hypothetical protein C1645_742829 [Glomus cerebriforme]
MITTARRTNHCTIAPYNNVKGNAPRSKIQNLTKIFAKFSTYMGAAVRIIKKLNKGKYMCIFFLDEKDLLDAIKVLITKSSMKVHTVCASLSRFSEIESIKLVTRGLFQHAFLVYKSVISATSFVTYWGTYILRDAVRVFPKFLTDEQRQLRKKFGCKLTSLPNNIQAHDLHDILRTMNAKSIFIPRNPVSYKPLNFAYINYKSEDARQIAMKTNYKVNGQDLFWCTENARTCNRCGSPSHLFNECPIRKQDSKKQQLNKLYNHYRPAQHRKPKSYADATKAHKDDKSHECNPSNEKCTSKQPESLSPHARELRAKTSTIPFISDPVIENTASSSISLIESHENPVDIEALKKESSET